MGVNADAQPLTLGALGIIDRMLSIIDDILPVMNDAYRPLVDGNGSLAGMYHVIVAW